MATEIERLAVLIEANTKSYERAMMRLQKTTTKAVNVSQRGFSRMNRSMNKTMVVARTLGQVLGFGTLGLGIKEIGQYADQWKRAGNLLRASGADQDGLNEKMSELVKLSIESRSSLEGTITLYTRLKRVTEGLGTTNEQLLQVTEAVNKSFKVTGVAASEQLSTIRQLTQGLASGRLGGEELRALGENAFLLAKAIAKEFDTTIGGLKELGKEGKLTPDRILKALINVLPDVREQFKKTNITIGDSFTNLRTAMVQYIGTSETAAASATAISTAVMALAENLDLVAKALVAVGAGLAASKLAGILVAMSAAAKSAGTFGAAIGRIAAIFGGPWSIAVTVGASALALFALKEDTAKKAAADLTENLNQLRKANKLLEKATGDNIEKFREEIGILRANTAQLILNAEARLEHAKRAVEFFKQTSRPGGVDRREAARQSGLTRLVEERAAALAGLKRQMREFNQARSNTAKKADLITRKDESKPKKKKGRSGARGVTAEDILKDARERVDAINLESQALGKSAGVQARLNAELEISRKLNENGIKLTHAQTKELQEYFTTIEVGTDKFEAMKKQMELFQEIGESVASTLDDAFAEFTESGKINFRNMITSMVQDFAKLAFKQTVSGPLGKLATGFLGNLFGGLVGPSIPSAKGNVFAGGVQKMASGAVLNSRTSFPLPGGTGLAGEAGPEAVLPLARGSGGKLGVMSQGGGKSVVIHQTNDFSGATQGAIAALTAEVQQMRQDMPDLVLSVFQRENAQTAGFSR